MKDMSDRIRAYGEAKRESELTAHKRKVNEVYDLIDYIGGRHKELDIAIANANAAVDAGIKLNCFNESHRDFEDGNFYANGIRHRLGFIVSELDKSIVGLGVIGGGYNGDVSVVYIDGEVIYDTDKYHRHNKAFQHSHSLMYMNDVLLGHYAYAFRTFAQDIDKFMACFEAYIEEAIS